MNFFLVENIEKFKKVFLFKWKKQVMRLDFEKAAILRDKIKSLKYNSIIS